MANNTLGRLITVKQGSKASNGEPTLEVAEFGFSNDVGQEELWIGSENGIIKILTELDEIILEIANITGLQDTLSSKADTTHNHDTVYMKITDYSIETDTTIGTTMWTEALTNVNS